MKVLLIVLGGLTSGVTALFIYSALVLAKRSDSEYEKEYYKE